MKRALHVAIPFLLMVLLPGLGISESIVETWPQPSGPKEAPAGWELQESTGSISEGDITVEDEEGKAILHLKSRDSSYLIGRENLEIDLQKTPLLTWRWKVRTLPMGADARDTNAIDSGIALHVTFDPEEAGERRAIGYLWNGSTPRCSYLLNPRENSFFKRRAFRLAGVPVTWFVILQNEESPTDVWLTETRDVAEDYRQIFNAPPPSVAAVAVQIDSGDTGTSAESFAGPIAFQMSGAGPEENHKAPCAIHALGP